MCSQLPAPQGRQVALPVLAVFGYFETGPGPLPLPLQCWADAGTSGGWAPLSPSPTPVSKPSISCHLCN